MSNAPTIFQYITIFKENNAISIPLENLTYSFNKKPSRKRLNNWKLIIRNKKKEVLSLETSDYGFSQETLELIVKELEEIQEIY
ncbi:MAG: hypothetical protein H6553_07845 [Chitinophagales bacterium]|nr:hypothetical protein [Chitinophagales bacterium]